MTDVSRRSVIGTALAGGAAVGLGAGSVTPAAAQPVESGGRPSFGDVQPALRGDTLPSFRFPLGEAKTMTYRGGSTVQEATVEVFPVSEEMAGALLTMPPGALRELHWHANAAEWAYVISGQARITILNPFGHSQTIDFGPGDVWYFPRGFGHSIQAIGSEPCNFVLIFDNGFAPAELTFSSTDWLGHTPAEVLAQTFGVPASRFEGFPKEQVFLTAGPVPGPLPATPAPGSLRSGAYTHRYQLLAQAPTRYAGGHLRIVSEREFPISETITGALLTIGKGGLREPHWHPNAVEWQYYISGRARMTVFASGGRARTEEFGPGDVGYVPRGYGHYIENIGDGDLEIVLGFNNGTYESIELTGWFASNTKELLATNFGVPAATFDGFPDAPVVIAGPRA
jgi:oxalate decarboxylase